MKLHKSAIITTWVSNVIAIISSVIAIPIVIATLSTSEINVWFLFGSVVALSKGLVLGFSVTFTRFISYSYVGVRINEFSRIRHKKTNKLDGQMDIVEFSRLFYFIKTAYLVLSILYTLLLCSIGYFLLSKPIGFLGNPIDGWIAFLIILLSSVVTLRCGYYLVLLNGINRVAEVQRIIGLVNIGGLLFILAVLFFCPTFISVITIYQAVSLSTTFALSVCAKKHIHLLNINIKGKSFDREILTISWESAWKSSMTTILANIIRHISALLVAQLYSPASSASFLFTKKLFDILDTFSKSVFQARLPVLSKLRGSGNFKALIPLLQETQIISYSVIVLGYLVLLLAGEHALMFIDSNVELGNKHLLILFSCLIFISRWVGMTSMISNIANHVVDHIYLSVVAIIYSLILFFYSPEAGVILFPLALCCGFIVASPILIKNVYTTLHTSFLGYEVKILFPTLGVLTLINLVYYFC